MGTRCAPMHACMHTCNENEWVHPPSPSSLSHLSHLSPLTALTVLTSHRSRSCLPSPFATHPHRSPSPFTLTVHPHRSPSPLTLTLTLHPPPSTLHPSPLTLTLTLTPRYSSARHQSVEEVHNTIHGIVGGLMATYQSAFHPIFWMHHCNVDRIFQRWLGLGLGLG